jgi:hypothetical protein
MRKSLEILILFLLSLIIFTLPCAASDNIIKLNDLIEQSNSLDNTEVTVQGELIGEALERGEYAWLNINDTTNATGIWVKMSDIDQIQFYGDYKHSGDIVKVTGVFHRACPDHGGDVDIHCTNIEIIQTGHVIKEQISTSKITVTFLLIVLAATTGGSYLLIRRKRIFASKS